MADTTIRLTDDTKALLDEHNRDTESYNETVRRLCGAADGQLWTDDEIRELIRTELHEQHRRA